MESGRARGYRDDNRLPPMSLGLSSVRLIVNNLEAEYARAFASSSQLVKYDSRIEDDYDPPLDPSSSNVFHRFIDNLGVALSRCIPSVSFGNFAFLAVLAGYFAPTMISYLVLYPFCRLVFGTLYPAYASYKAVRTKNLKEYVKWMMYWIVFALFTCTETFTDVFLSWFPFYYEVKIVLVLWLLSPATKGSSILYRKFVHPALCRREQEIDEYIAKAKDQGYHTVLNLGTKGVNYATTVIMQTAIKGGGGLVQQLRKSYSLSDLSESVRDAGGDEADDVLAEPGVIRALTVRSGYNTRRSASESSRSPMYFPEVDVDVDVRAARSSRDEPDLTHIKSSEDISSGYSSADNSNISLSRTASVGGARPRARPGAKTSVTTIKRPQAAEDSEVIIEELRDDDLDDYTSMPPLMNVPSPLYLSHSDPPFIYQYVGDQIRIVQVIGDPLKHLNKTTEKANQKDILSEAPANINSPAVGDKIVTQDLTQTNDYHNKVGIDNIGDTSLENHSSDADEKKVAQDLAQTDSNQNKIESETTDDTFFESIDQNNNDNKYDSTKDRNTLQVILETETVDVDPNSLTINNEPNIVENICDKTEPVKDNATETEMHPPPTDTKPNNDTKDEVSETTSLNTSANEIDTAESDDEASFGTPENSPKSRRKSLKGRYGKGKAPPPPKSDVYGDVKDLDKSIDISAVTTPHESLVDIVKSLPNTTFEEGRATSSLMVNPIAEKKRRHKSKSPGNIPKGNSSAIGKLLQLPAKFAFWNKNDNKSKGERDSMSISSGDLSRRSSTMEGSEDFQSSNDLHTIPDTVTENVENFEGVNKADDQISFKDASDLESEVITHDIMEKSDALQKLIEAKIESHPEYKYVLEENELPATSKSTETQV